MVIPVAGLGTRVLPASKVVPKEMMAVVDKPVIQYVIEEAVESGFTEIILVTRESKAVIEQHFEANIELEQALESSGKTRLLDSVRDILPPGIRLSTVIQDQQLGLGHAVLCAAPLVGEDDFAVSLPDVLVFDPEGNHSRDLNNLVAAFNAKNAAQIMVEAVPEDQVDRYGIVDCGDVEFVPGESRDITAMVEKPPVDQAPSNQSIIGRYVLPARVMEILQQTRAGTGGEIQLTDAINLLVGESPVQAFSMQGITLDCGNKLGYLIAGIEFGLHHPETAAGLKSWLANKDF